MDYDLKVQKIIDMGFVLTEESGAKYFIYKGLKWSESEIEYTPIAEIIKYKIYYDGYISIKEFNESLDMIRHY